MEPYTLSSLPCTRRYSGIPAAITAATTAIRKGNTATNTSAVYASFTNAIAVAPNTMSGERNSRRRVMFTPACT